MREFGKIDHIIDQFDTALRTLFGRPQTTGRGNPADDITECKLTTAEKNHAAGLMRINHAGEVCAQGLYQGQAATARLTEIRDKMRQASAEENDHLAWCENRLQEFGSHTSFLNPFWYVGSFVIGSAAGLVGDKWSLGFVAETEKQVVKHLDSHLDKLPAQDEKSRAILVQMKIDENEHATAALHAGGAKLPEPVKQAMGLTSKIMTTLAYRI